MSESDYWFRFWRCRQFWRYNFNTSARSSIECFGHTVASAQSFCGCRWGSSGSSCSCCIRTSRRWSCVDQSAKLLLLEPEPQVGCTSGGTIGRYEAHVAHAEHVLTHRRSLGSVRLLQFVRRIRSRLAPTILCLCVRVSTCLFSLSSLLANRF